MEDLVLDFVEVSQTYYLVPYSCRELCCTFMSYNINLSVLNYFLFNLILLKNMVSMGNSCVLIEIH